MLRFACASIVLGFFALSALAQSDADRRARVEQALNQLPDRAEIEAAIDQIPNITGALTGLMEVANDKDNQKEFLIGDNFLVGRIAIFMKHVEN